MLMTPLLNQNLITYMVVRKLSNSIRATDVMLSGKYPSCWVW